MMQGTGLKNNSAHLCNATDHETTKHLQFVQVGATSENVSGKCPGILTA